MYQVNDNVMYSTTGVCRITEIRKQKIMGDIEMDYYVLLPIYAKNSTIMAPVDKADQLMRKITSKDHIDKTLSQIPSYEVKWVEDDRQRAEHFRQQLKTGSLEEWTKLIKTLLTQQQLRQEQGKKLRQSDENVLRNAQRLINEEFATSLQIPVEQVSDYIKSRM